MKTNISFTVVAATLAMFAFSAVANDTLLSPRASDNQVRKSPAADVTITTATATPAVRVVMSPRAADNQVVKNAGGSTAVNPAEICAKKMTGSPKAIGACLENPKAMAGCKHTNTVSQK